MYFVYFVFIRVKEYAGIILDLCLIWFCWFHYDKWYLYIFILIVKNSSTINDVILYLLYVF